MIVSQQGNLNFDKFMKDLEAKEEAEALRKRALQKNIQEWQARTLLRKYREHPLNLREFKKNK